MDTFASENEFGRSRRMSCIDTKAERPFVFRFGNPNINSQTAGIFNPTETLFDIYESLAR